MRIEFKHPDPAAVPWQKGEIVTLQVVELVDGTYTVETIETYPPDLKERHALELAGANAEHAQTAGQLLLERQAHEAGVTALRRSLFAGNDPVTIKVGD